MPFYQPIHQKKFMKNIRGRKKYPASTYPKKKNRCELRGWKKKFMHIPNHPPPPPPQSKMAGPLNIVLDKFFPFQSRIRKDEIATWLRLPHIVFCHLPLSGRHMTSLNLASLRVAKMKDCGIVSREPGTIIIIFYPSRTVVFFTLILDLIYLIIIDWLISIFSLPHTKEAFSAILIRSVGSKDSIPFCKHVSVQLSVCWEKIGEFV